MLWVAIVSDTDGCEGFFQKRYTHTHLKTCKNKISIRKEARKGHLRQSFSGSSSPILVYTYIYIIKTIVTYRAINTPCYTLPHLLTPTIKLTCLLPLLEIPLYDTVWDYVLCLYIHIFQQQSGEEYKVALKRS